MKDILYIVFNKKGIVKTLKTKPTNEHFIKLTVFVEDQYFSKHTLEATLKVDKDADLTIEDYEIMLKRIKNI